MLSNLKFWNHGYECGGRFNNGRGRGKASQPWKYNLIRKGKMLDKSESKTN